jgi:carbonic anhydrase
MLKLLPGLHQFKKEIHYPNKEFFYRLSHGQNPEAIMITCSDARIVTSLLTMTSPGDLFIIRNAGNIVPAYADHVGAEAAAIEFAVVHLHVKDIIVLGHLGCGAIAGLLKPETLQEMPDLIKWLAHAEKTKRILCDHYKEDEFSQVHDLAVQENVLVQLENIRTLPCVSKRLWKREIELHGWVYDIESGRVYIYDPIDESFQPFVVGPNGFEFIPSEALVRSNAAGGSNDCACE